MGVTVEGTRLGVLRRYQELVQAHGPRGMQQVCRIAVALTGAAAAAVHLIDRDTAHRVASEGVPLGTMSRSDALCDVVVRTGESVVTSDAVADPRFRDLVVEDGPEPPPRFYASVPLLAPDGSVLGTLCTWDPRPLPPGPDVLLRLEDLAEGVVGRLELARVTHDLAHVATHDPVTGLPNRALLRDRLGQALAARRHLVLVAVLELEGFDDLEREHGHPAASALIGQVGARLRCLVRPQDTVARVASDDFVAVLSDSGPVTPEALTARLRGAFREPYDLGGGPVALRPLLGAVRAHPDDRVDGVLDRATVERHAAAALERHAAVALERADGLPGLRTGLTGWTPQPA